MQTLFSPPGENLLPPVVGERRDDALELLKCARVAISSSGFLEDPIRQPFIRESEYVIVDQAGPVPYHSIGAICDAANKIDGGEISGEHGIYIRKGFIFFGG